MKRQRTGEPKSRAEQLAEALYQVAAVNHYMVGLVEPHTREELEAAEQLLITAQNKWHPANVKYKRYDLALDLVEQHKRQALPGWAVSRG
jgi:hypothetical protein